MALNPEQWELNKKRIAEHKHPTYQIDLDVGSGILLKGFSVHPNVLRPEKTSAIYFARYLASCDLDFSGKEVLDLGCGTGIQGIMAAIRGAQKVVMSDIAEHAVANAFENVRIQRLEALVDVRKSDLFEAVNESFDVIIFNQPFFAEKPLPDEPITIAIFDEGELIRRFFLEAKKHLKKGGIIIMPFFHFAGTTNDPGIRGPEFGYNIASKTSVEVNDDNIQKGTFSVYVLTP